MLTYTLRTPLIQCDVISPTQAKQLQRELKLHTLGDLLTHYPLRYENRTQLQSIGTLVHDTSALIQVTGNLTGLRLVGRGKSQRLVGQLQDDTGVLDLVWFQRVAWLHKKLKVGGHYVSIGHVNVYNKRPSLVHPEMILSTQYTASAGLVPVYPATAKLTSKTLRNLQERVVPFLTALVEENLPAYLLQRYRLVGRRKALQDIHFPTDTSALHEAKRRLKFEELLLLQVRVWRVYVQRRERLVGQVFDNQSLQTQFKGRGMPFTLTGAQHRVVAEIAADMRDGKQMNRLLQGDVGSGKTIVAFLSMLLPLAHGAQVALMAPTELLAGQHYDKLRQYAQGLGIRVALLTGSTKATIKRRIMEGQALGTVQIVVGTHALLEEGVKFKRLGLAVIDEQHRFGVAQRAKLWNKSGDLPHVLVMTATPIPRTLAMTTYGDLDVSVLDEVPAGRNPVKTRHCFNTQRLQVFQLLRDQLAQGRQGYVVYPLIEASSKLDYQDLMDGYESICRAFPQVPLSIVHGRMGAAEKAYEMERFARGETKLMVATTVIEVGIDVPNAAVMLIESADRFGLAQLHQLRGRVGRGKHQGYCVLMTDYKLSKTARQRMQTMVDTVDGFAIANADMKLRGPGSLWGVQQSGLLRLKLSDLQEDEKILVVARKEARQIIEESPSLSSKEYARIRGVLEEEEDWSQFG